MELSKIQNAIVIIAVIISNHDLYSQVDVPEIYHSSDSGFHIFKQNLIVNVSHLIQIHTRSSFLLPLPQIYPVLMIAMPISPLSLNKSS